MRLRPFFKYFGGKYRAAKRYPAPTHDAIVEPFAGSAGYSVLHHERDVILADTAPEITAIWQYLIRVDESELLVLPDVHEGESLDDERFVGLDPGARWLIGFWLNGGPASPCKRPCSWMLSGKNPSAFWCEGTREMLASQLRYIRHWTVVDVDDYSDLSPVEATWFVDPPYVNVKDSYHGTGVRHDELGNWCRTLPGQVIVCEMEGAEWLPFRPLFSAAVAPSRHKKHTHRTEMSWMSG